MSLVVSLHVAVAPSSIALTPCMRSGRTATVNIELTLMMLRIDPFQAFRHVWIPSRQMLAVGPMA
jgi:hypothetical protein